MRTIRLIARFYNGIFLANFLVTASCIYLLGSFGKKAHEIVAVLFYYKLIAMLLIFFTAVFYNKKELYYYQNLGVSKFQLGFFTSVFDFMLAAGLIVVQRLLGVPAGIFNIAILASLVVYLIVYIRQ